MSDPGLPTNSLSESWTSLSNSDYPEDDDQQSDLQSDLHSDLQSEDTDTGSLIDVDGEDVHSIDERDDSTESDLQPQKIEDSVVKLPDATEPAMPGDKPDLRSSKAQSQSRDPDSIVFDQPENWPEVGHIDVKHTLKVFQEDDTDHLRESLPTRTVVSQLIGAIRMTMSRNGLPLHQPFRVLYNGPPSALDARREILQTLAGALVVDKDSSSYHRSMESSRYHVFPINNFGRKASPDLHAEMIPIETQLIVDECVDATSVEDSSGQEQIMLSLKNGDLIHSRWDGIWQSVQDRRRWTRPDIAVLLACNETDSIVRRQTTRLMHECMLRHNVPTLVITEEADWSDWSQTLPLDPQSLHRCIEGRSSAVAGARVLRRLPIDIDTFANLAPDQLNKHLACLSDVAQSRIAATPRHVSFMATEISQSRPAETLNDVEKNLTRSYMAQNQKSDLLRPLLKLRNNLVLVTFALAIVGWLASSIPFRQGIPAMVSYGSASAPATMTTAAMRTPTLIDMLAKPKISANRSPSDVSVVREKTDIARLLADPNFVTVNKSEKFQAEMIGDDHIIVKFPQRHLNVRKGKEPAIQIRVSRGKDTLDSVISKVFEGVYSVKLKREEAYGPVNLTVVLAKPLLSETIELDFGSQWLKVASWEKASQKLISRMLQDIHPTVQSVTQSVGEIPWIKQGQSSLKHHSQQIRNLSQNIVAMMKDPEWRQQSYNRMAERVQSVMVDVKSCSDQQRRIITEKITYAQISLQSMLRTSGTAKERAREYTDVAMTNFKWYVDMLQKRFSQIELPDVRRKLQDVTYSVTLAKAQDRAQKLVRDSADKLKQHRQNVKTKKAYGKKRGKKYSRR